MDNKIILLPSSFGNENNHNWIQSYRVLEKVDTINYRNKENSYKKMFFFFKKTCDITHYNFHRIYILSFMFMGFLYSLKVFNFK